MGLDIRQLMRRLRSDGAGAAGENGHLAPGQKLCFAAFVLILFVAVFDLDEQALPLSWGIVNRYCTETGAQFYNDQGRFEIGGKKYKIEIVPIDDKNDPKLAVSGAERLTKQDGIHYIIGAERRHDCRESALPRPSVASISHMPLSENGLFAAALGNAVSYDWIYQAGPSSINI